MHDDNIQAAPLGPRVVAVEPMDNFRLFLTFTNGERRVFDAKPLFKYPVFKLLQKKPFFDSVKVDHGSVQWPNDIDYCPDTLYMQSVPAA